MRDRHNFPPNIFRHSWLDPQAEAVEGLSMLCSCTPLATINLKEHKIIVCREISKNHLCLPSPELVVVPCLLRNHLELIYQSVFVVCGH